MLEEDVSGKKKKRRIVVKLPNHISIHIVHLQLSAWATKPPAMGAVAGAHTAKVPQSVMPYTRFLGLYKSPIVAPPVARIGEPTKPVMKRNARSMPKFVDRAVGI